LFSSMNANTLRTDSRPVLVVHIVNAPVMLGFFTGQTGFFRAHGFSLEAVSSPGHGLEEFSRREGVPVHVVTMSMGIKPLRDLVTVYRLWRLLLRLHPVIVHAHSPKGGVLGMTAAWLAGTPIRVYHLRALPRVAAGQTYKLLLQWAGRVTGRLAHRVLCVSQSIRQAALDQRLFPPEKARVLAHGAIGGLDSATRFNPKRVGRDTGRAVRATLRIPADARVLGFVGRVVRDKGVMELAEAWRDLRTRYTDTHLLVLGRIRSDDPIPADVEKILRNDPRVHLVDWADDTPPYYAAMDVLALPSYREGLGYVLLEGAAMELPVVATAVPGCVDAVVDGVTGTLVPPYDSRSLARAVAAYLDDPSLRQKHGRAGRERVVREFGQRQAREALLEEYRQLLAGRFGRTQITETPVEPGEQLELDGSSSWE
jgi:glycosyltransferase involved in cell wall biosynthesis